MKAFIVLLFLLHVDRSREATPGEFKRRFILNIIQPDITNVLDDKDAQRQLFQEFSRARLMGNGNSLAAELLFKHHDRGVVEESGRRVIEESGRGIFTESGKEVFEEISSGADALRSSVRSSAGRVDNQLASQTHKASVQIQTTPMKNKTRCDTDLDRLASGVVLGELWALQLIDAWGKPSSSILDGRLNFAGGYQQCRSVTAPAQSQGMDGFKGNYCAVGMLVELLQKTNVTVQLGACMPDTCTELEIGEFVASGLARLNLTFAVGTPECRTDYREVTLATKVSIAVLSIIGVLMLLGSCYDILRQRWNPWELGTLPAPGSPVIRQTPRYGAMPDGDINRTSKPDTLQDVSGSRVLQGDVIHVMKDDETGVLRDVTRVMQGDVSQAIRDDLAETKEETSLLLTGTEKTVRRKWSVLVDILLAFSVYTNGKKVLDTRQPAGSLTAIHGIRFLSMTWVILGHTYNVSISILGSTPTTVLLEHIKRWTFDAVFNASVSVDTFFTLSGLLVAYLTCKEIFKKGWKINWPLFYFHRFWRLTPPYMLTILLVLGLQRFMGSGALWPMQMPVDKTFCENNWWTNLLYINNIVHNDEMCLEQSWYLANDMQFYVLSPLMLIPFYFHAYAGLASCLVFLLAQWITTGILATQNDWPATPLFNVPAKPGALNWQLYYYFAPYCRIGPYVVGIIVGYFLAVSNGKIKMRKYVVCIGWALATAVALAVLYGLRGDISGDHYSSVGVAALYLALARSAWGASVAWVVVACASGYGGPVNAILSWPPFVVLGRLTYMAYLIHPCLMIAYFANMESPYYTIDTSIAISFLGILVVVNMASFVLMLALESPMISLEKIFLGKSKKNA